MKRYEVSRVVAAALLMLYGFGKLTGAQFTTLDSELDKPLREVSGFWLTWYYFGYSPVYGTILALVQIAGAVALLLPRLVLASAAVLFLVVGNIILIDVFYGIELAALAAAIVIEICLATILAEHRGRIANLFLAPEARGTRRGVAIASVLAAITFGAAYYIANYNNRLPTPIDGTWVVANPAADGPTRVYFERNRAFLSVFRHGHRMQSHHFEVDTSSRRVTVWMTWLSKGPMIYEGTYAAGGAHMRLVSPRGETLMLSRLPR